MQQEEQDIMSALRAGDRKAFEMIFRNWYNPLCNFANSFLCDKEEAEELVQNAFVHFWEKREDIQIETSLKSYLYRSVRNASLNILKHQKVKYQHEKFTATNSTSWSDAVSDALHSSELAARIEGAIQKLPEQCQLVFRLSRHEELKYAEIATQLNISVKTVENHMGKALRIMREELKDYLIILLFIVTYMK